MDRESKILAQSLNNGAPITTQVGAYNTYVGARYVPKFANPAQWNPNVAYEPLTIVINQGNSYTSAQFVPAGVPLQDDGPYWFITGNFNSQVESYRQEVQAVANQVSENTSDIATIKTWKNHNVRTCLYIGNSYATGVEEEANNGLYNRTKDYWDYSYLKSASGAGFLSYSGGTSNYVELLQSAITDSTINNAIITDVLFICAVGDTRAYSQNQSEWIPSMNTALESVQDICNANFPNLKRVMVVYAEGRAEQQSINAPMRCYYEVNHVFNILCPRYGIEYLGPIGWETMHEASMFWTDGYHPGAYGNTLLATLLRKCFSGGYTPSVKSVNRQINYQFNGESTEGIIQLSMTPNQTVITFNTNKGVANVPLSPNQILCKIVFSNNSSYSYIIPNLYGSYNYKFSYTNNKGESVGMSCTFVVNNDQINISPAQTVSMDLNNPIFLLQPILY